MKQFICILITLAVSAGLLFLVSAPINNVHESEGEHGEETHAEETLDAHGEAAHEEEPAASAAH